MRWFRFYDDVVNDPKVQRLPAPLFKLWVNVLCLASKNNGALPPIADMAFVLRLSDSKVAAALDELAAAGLLDKAESGFEPHNWHGRQFESDSAAERMRRHRQRMRDVTVTSQVTPPAANSDATEQNQIQNQIQNREEKKEGAQERAPRATRLALDTLPDDWRAYCVENHPDLNPEAMWHEFHDYWKACGGGKARKVDWLATWRMWLRRARDFRSGNGRNQGDRPSRGQLLAAEALALGERFDRDSELRERAGPRNE